MSLLDDLRAEGLTVIPGTNWETHSALGQFTPIGILNHWDAIRGWPGVELYRRSPRPELNHQPTYHVVVEKDGTCHLISQGHVYGAGGGDKNVLDAMRHDRAPIPPARVQKNTGGNRWFWAVCVNYWPDGSPLPQPQYDALVRVNAALCRRVGWWAFTRVNDHDGWTTRKNDLSGQPPANWDLTDFRRDVQAVIEGADEVKIPQPNWLPDATIDRLLKAGVLKEKPVEETEEMWRTLTFIERSNTGLGKKIAAAAAGGASTAVVIAEIVNRLS